jgi:hypothetical protein
MYPRFVYSVAEPDPKGCGNATLFVRKSKECLVGGAGKEVEREREVFLYVQNYKITCSQRIYCILLTYMFGTENINIQYLRPR